MLMRKSKVSTKFVLTIAIIYSLIILLILFSYLYILKINTSLLRETVLRNHNSYLLNKTTFLIDFLKQDNVQNTHELYLNIKKCCIKYNDILYILIFSKTVDDNFYKVKYKISLNPSLKINARINKTLREKKNINFLKRGLFQPVIDPQIYSSNNLYYKSIYHPYKIKNNNLVIEFFISSSSVITALNEYTEKIDKIKKYSVVLAGIAVIIVIILAIVFIYNFSLLVRTLSRNFKKAAEGSEEVNLDIIEDDDLKELTHSFKNIVTELKEKKDSAAELFKLGVELLKDEKYDNAISVFKTITIIKPGAFGSYFNIGVAYARKKEYSNSIQMFEKALESNPEHKLTLSYIEKVKRLQISYERTFQ